MGVGCAETGGEGHGVLQGRDHLRVGMAQNHRTPRAHKIHILRAVNIEHPRAFSANKVTRSAPDSRKRSNWGAYPAGDAVFGAGVPV
ncbi:MAG: Uncharacterised protein [Cellulomonadaceae bacterium TMED98]|nr:MAG: Uncharacterised protein [Cellulomonadaceae bacterium TMED98]